MSEMREDACGGPQACAAGAENARAADETVRQAVLRALADIAPEADLAALRPDRPMRDQLDIDSFDFLNLLVALNAALGVDVPESDYGRVATLDAMVDYLARRGAGRSAGTGPAA